MMKRSEMSAEFRKSGGIFLCKRKEVEESISRVFGRIEGERLVSCSFAMGTRVSG